MRRFTLLTVFVIAGLFGFSQEFLNMDFSGGVPSDGWTIDAHQANWSQSSTDKAGGTAPEAKFYWDPNFVGVSRLISPVVDLTGVSSVVLKFNHMLDDYNGSGGYSLKAETTSDGGATWNEVWSVSPGGDIPAETQMITINNSDVGSATFQVALVFDGNSYNLDNWYIDDVSLFTPLDLDASMNAITMPTVFSEPTAVTGSFTNMGNLTIYDFDINWQADDGDVHTTSFTGMTVDPFSTYEFSCDDLFSAPIGTYLMHVWISNVNGQNDDNPDNDSATFQAKITSYTVALKPLFEEFTSSTCSPCAGFNAQFVPWCNQHEDEITLVKYQMNWPGSGDPYYTNQGGDRRAYYGVTWVPWLNLNGSQIETSLSAVNAGFDQVSSLKTTFKIAASFEMDGAQITVNANVLPFDQSDNVKVHMVVFENETTENTGSNGETSFQHVMMRMLPDAFGADANFVDREPLSFSGTYDMSQTFVEELDDLGVAIIVQNEASQEVLQSAYAIQDADFSDNDNLLSLYYDNTEIPDFDPNVLEYTVALPAGTTTPPVVSTGGAEDPNATIVIIQPETANGMATVDVFSEELMTHKTYTIDFTIVGVDESALSNIRIYPNPSSDYLYVTDAENVDVKIVAMDGKIVYHSHLNGTRKIDIRDFAQGAYMIQVSNDRFSTTKRFVKE